MKQLTIPYGLDPNQTSISFSVHLDSGKIISSSTVQALHEFGQSAVLGLLPYLENRKTATRNYPVYVLF